MTTLGYARSAAGSIAKQEMRLLAAGCQRVYVDLGHPAAGWRECESVLQDGDTLKVVTASRISRDATTLLDAVKSLRGRGVWVVALDGSLTSPNLETT